ncbi:MAG: DnaD domain protein [Clostridia bacterium]|nr:DnaD domain protein [Clostridia bacterium]
MNKKIYAATALTVTQKEAFLEASREELRVLVAIMETRGAPLSEEELSKLSGTSLARTKSALALWEAEGVISVSEQDTNIIYEFEETISRGEISEESSKEVAEGIRNNHLEALLSECAKIMGRTSLATHEIKNISALYTQYSLSTEYILNLAAHLASRSKLTSVRLRDKAIELVEHGCDDAESLSIYIENAEKSSSEEWEMRRLFGIYSRAVTPSERKYFKRWTEELGFFSEIISEAYDIAVLNTGKASLPYIDKILGAWHEAGCKTAAECRAYNDKSKSTHSQKTQPRTQRAKKSENPTPKYGNFDANDAFLAALDRSYTKEDK